GASPATPPSSGSPGGPSSLASAHAHGNGLANRRGQGARYGHRRGGARPGNQRAHPEENHDLQEADVIVAFAFAIPFTQTLTGSRAKEGSRRRLWLQG